MEFMCIKVENFWECENKIDINFEPHKEGDDKI
jgi:hypothetical protein